MKSIKIIIGLITGLLLMVSASSFAAGDLTTLRAVKHQGSNSLKAQAHFATEVHVVNNSAEIITVKVPGANIYDSLYPHEIEDIYSDIYFDAIEVVLYDSAGYEFFREFVPNHSTVVIDNIFYGAAAAGEKGKHKVRAMIQK